jgi:hypothetical protein
MVRLFEVNNGREKQACVEAVSLTDALVPSFTGETIPIRLFLGGFELTPTFRDVNKKFSTRYYLNLVLIDEENRRYFKQNEITCL